MSKTVDELARIYDDAYEDRARLEFPTPEMKRAMHRAGIAAVVRALRDEMDRQRGDDWRWGDTVYFFNSILGDAGAGKVAGVAALEAVGAGLSPASGQAPATDPAPAVCVWTKGFETYENRKWWRAGCGWSFYGKPPFVNCRRCGKPIKFTEAKT